MRRNLLAEARIRPSLSVLSAETINSCRSVLLHELTTALYDVRALWEATRTYPALSSAENQPFDKSSPDEKKPYVSCMAAETRHVRVFVYGMDGYRQEENDQRKALAEMACDFPQEAHQNKALLASYDPLVKWLRLTSRTWW